MMKKRNKQGGYTLMEAMIVMCIIGILASICHYSGLFGLLIPGWGRRPMFPIVADRHAPTLCHSAMNDLNLDDCIDFGQKRCVGAARQVMMDCFEKAKKHVPMTSTQLEEDVLLTTSKKCIANNWGLEILKHNVKNNKRCKHFAENHKMARKQLKKIQQALERQKANAGKPDVETSSFYESLYDGH